MVFFLVTFVLVLHITFIPPFTHRNSTQLVNNMGKKTMLDKEVPIIDLFVLVELYFILEINIYVT